MLNKNTDKIQKAFSVLNITTETRSKFINQLLNILHEWNFRPPFCIRKEGKVMRIPLEDGITRLFDNEIVRLSKNLKAFQRFCDEKPLNQVTLMELIDNGTPNLLKFRREFRRWSGDVIGSTYLSVGKVPFSKRRAHEIIRTQGAMKATVCKLILVSMVYQHLRKSSKN